MEKGEIIKLLNNYNRHNNPFKRLSVLELSNIMTFFEKEFKTEKGNWSMRKTKYFHKKNEINNSCKGLKNFYNQYSKRKKELKSFELHIHCYYNAVNKLRYKSNLDFEKKYIEKKLRLLELKDKNNLREFLKELRNLKDKFLLGSNEDLLRIVDNEIKIGVKKSTLRNYFYDID